MFFLILWFCVRNVRVFKMDNYLFMNTLNFPILSTAIFMPFAGAVLLLFMKSDKAIKFTALLAGIVNFRDLAASLFTL